MIINNELSRIKSPESLEELSAENLTVNGPASAVNEVTTASDLDENQLEIALKIPNDWLLQRVTGDGQGLEKNPHVGRSLARQAFGCTANHLVSGV